MNITDLKKVIASGTADWKVILYIQPDRYGNDLCYVEALDYATGIRFELDEFQTSAHPRTVARFLQSHDITFKACAFKGVTKLPALLAKYGFSESGDLLPEQQAEQPEQAPEEPTLPKKKCEVCGKYRQNFKSGQNCFNYIENASTRRWQCQILGYGNTVFTPAESLKAIFTGGKL